MSKAPTNRVSANKPTPNKPTPNKPTPNKPWRTKWGWRSVRVELPTLDEALEAASDLTSERAQQIQLAADLMQVPAADVSAAAERILEKRAARPPERQSSSGRIVVVERKIRRHATDQSKPSPAQRRSA